MSLTSPALTETTIESATMRLFDEWLASYFDGAQHSIGPVEVSPPVTFPKAELAYQGKALPQPLDSGAQAAPLGISLVWATPGGRIDRHFDHALIAGVPRPQHDCDCQALLQFIIRTDNTEIGGLNGEARVRQASDLLYALLNNPYATGPLAEKGIQHLFPQPGILLSSGPGAKGAGAAIDYHARLIQVRCTLRWTVFSQSLPS